MAKTDDTGIYQLKNGCYAYRIVKMVNGKKFDSTRKKDADGNSFKTKAQARADRDRLKVELDSMNIRKKKNMTLGDVWEFYLQNGAQTKAYSTVKKQKSLWENHIGKKYGNRQITSFSVGEINDYIAGEYLKENRKYGYVVSFVKMFYLLFGTAQKYDFIDYDYYRKMCGQKELRIKMPDRKIGDKKEDVRVFTRSELEILDNTFLADDCNAKVAYALGRFAGLRISEAYGLKWDNVDFKKGTIYIDRQMQYEEGIWKLVHPKTNAGIRTIEMSKQLKKILLQRRNELKEMQSAHMDVLKQNETMLLDMDGKRISSLELVNSTPEGKMQTVNSMKYWSRKINEEELHTDGFDDELEWEEYISTKRFYTVELSAGVDIWEEIEDSTNKTRAQLITEEYELMEREGIILNQFSEMMAGSRIMDKFLGKRSGDELYSTSVKFKKLEFKYHWLRHTFCSLMATAGTPATDLCRIAGHSKIDTTYKYYTNRTELSSDKVISAMENL